MPQFNRRDLLQAASAVTAGALLPGVVRAAAPAATVLAYVAPELRPAAERTLALVARSGPLTEAALPKIRAMSANMAAPQRTDVPVAARQVPVGGGAPDVTVYVVNAKPGAAPRPAILHTHGGGFVLGRAKDGIAALQTLAQDLDCVIVTVDYRLAPETRYTGSIEDNYAGLKWLHTQAATLGVDPKRIAVMGESAGGGHAALLAITARDRGEVPVAFQCLIYPMLDDRTGSTVIPPPFIGAIGWDAAANRLGWRAFLGMTPGTPQVPAAAVPARTADLHGLPPAFIAVGGVDLFVAEDIAYARRLTETGIATELLVIPSAFHGFDGAAPDSPQAHQLNAAKRAALRRAFTT